MKRWLYWLLWLGLWPQWVWAQDTMGDRPVALAGLTVYATDVPVRLDGTASYDPYDGPLSYQWHQIAGTPLTIRDEDSATPEILGFAMTNDIQRFTFELVVSNGRHFSEPNTVDLVVVADFGAQRMEVLYQPFDVNKPTFIGFSGGDCYNGRAFVFDRFPAWRDHLNIVSSKGDYRPPYSRYADATIALLAKLAPNYRQKIQTGGFSTGGQPAMDVALRLNGNYADPRYNVNQVSLFDAMCRSYYGNISKLRRLSVDGETAWVANYTVADVRDGTLNILFPGEIHQRPRRWHEESIQDSLWTWGPFNFGLYGGFYLSVAGPARNLQLGPRPDAYRFIGSWSALDHYDEAQYPGRLPEPVILLGPLSIPDSNDALLTCVPSRNAVAYEFLVGDDPYRVCHYTVLTDTPAPPSLLVCALPPDTTWWTIRARDAYGSTIYADPQPIAPKNPHP
jgi:hypothetical protein